MLGNKIMKKKNYAITSVCYFKNTNGNKYDGKFSHEKTFQSTEKKKKERITLVYHYKLISTRLKNLLLATLK